MKCSLCGTVCAQRRATPRNPYHYALSGLPNVFLYGISVRVCPSCKTESPIIPAVGELHRAIAETLARKPAPLSGAEIRFLRKNIGIPARKLAAVLGIAPETLSRIENGKTGGLRPGLEHLVRLLARSATTSETLREAVLQVAEVLEGRGLERPRPRPIRLKPDREGGWKPAAA